MNTKKNTSAALSKQHSTGIVEDENHKLFSKENYKWMIIGALIMIVGFFLMAGGKSNNPDVFNESEIYSFRRITLAPILIVAGLVVEIFAIMKKQK